MYSGATPEFIDGDVFKTKISLNEANRSDGGVNGGVSGGVSGGVKLSEINREVLECIKENGEFNAEKIAEKIKRGKRTVERAIKSLKEQGIIEKVVCRYPQFFAATKLLENIKIHQKPEGDGKGGTYFGATGCGKSYTMLFLTRMLMRSKCFKSPTIIVITDRTDLDTQLSGTFCNAKQFIGDNVVESIESREMLRRKLQGRASGGVYLTTIQKFTEDTMLLSDRTNIICISDEAHRSQVNLDQKVRVTEKGVERHFGFAKYLHDSLPNATYVGFTGTPIDATIDVFGSVVEKYTMTESVKDGITVNLVYEGRAAKVTLDKNKLEEIEAYYAKCEDDGANEHQIEESKKPFKRYLFTVKARFKQELY